MKRIVIVKFLNYNKAYAYYTNVDLAVGAIYDIVADGRTKYSNYVKVVGYHCKDGYLPGVSIENLRTITSAKLISGVARPDDRIEKFIFDEEKGVTVALWKDGTKTIIRCQEGDTFDKEKAIALCYMKKALGNRGSFNETLKKWTK